MIVGRGAVQRLLGEFPGPHAQGLLDIEDENLAVADLAGLGGFGDGLDDLVGHRGGHHDFQLDLGHEVHRVFGAPIDFGVTGLRAEALDLGHHHAAHARLGQCLAHLLELERLDCRNDQFHVFPLFCSGGSGFAPAEKEPDMAAQGTISAKRRWGRGAKLHIFCTKAAK